MSENYYHYMKLSAASLDMQIPSEMALSRIFTVVKQSFLWHWEKSVMKILLVKLQSW